MGKRCFLGVDVTEGVRNELSKVQSEMKKIDADMKWVGPKNFHFNIKFFGNLKEDSIEQVVDRIYEAVEEINPFSVDLEGVGVFPSSDFIKVIWAGVEDPEDFREVVTSVEDSLSEIGIEKEDREYVPHVTLGRMKSGKGKEEVKELLEKFEGKEFGEMKIEKFILYESILKKEGPTYKKIEEFKL